ncbi:sensor histidine kinase [Parabacteroides distasonis]|uniref:sensor histidine kinase n=1 Tax=Parabacteroides distasonis TaxID=823 RepID=UPI00197D49CC|nr:PAS domain-containing sensor histidine kinase [Parabacteroides distasonis]
MRNIILFIFIILTVHLNMSARGSGEKPSIVVLHSINFEESWTKQTYLDIERKFGEEGFTVKAIPLQIPGIRTMEGFQEKRTMILERVPVPPTLVVCIGDPSRLVARPLFDKEWKDIPSIICYARDYMYPKEEYQIDLDKNVLDTLVPITDVVKGYNATFIKYPVYIKQTIELIKKLQPELTKLAFIFDRRYISQQTKADVEAVLRKDFPGIQFEPLSTTSISTENLLDRLASFDNKTGVLYYSWYRTRKDNENRYLVDNVQKMTNSFSVPPIFTLQDVQTENGNFAGGYYVSPEDYAQVTVNTIEMILSGKDSKEIPIQTAETPRAYLNYQHLLLHQIDPGLYPPNATYFQEPPGFLQKYKIHIISLLVILALLITIGILRVRLFIQKQKAKDKELQIARQAQDLNQKYQLVLKASNMMTWIWDVKEARLECNNIYLTQRSIRDKGIDGLFSMSADEFYSGIHPEDLEQMQDAINKLIAGESISIDEEIRYLDDTGLEYTWIEIFAIVGKTDPEGKSAYLTGGTTLINQRKKMEQELRDKEKIEESNRLKSAFLANMSHEIRTPLNAIVGFSNLLAETCHSEETREFCEIIETNNELLLQLVNDILDLSKIEAGQMDFIYSEFNVSTLFRSLYQTFQSRVKDGVTLYCEIPEQDCVIYSEKNRLTQVITNFLTNACKFTFQGSIRMGYKEREDGLYFYVKDTGKGIERKNLPHVFERFAKFDSFIQGTGLGLSICQTILENLHGKIGVESEEGKGSTFWFTIPCAVSRP